MSFFLSAPKSNTKRELAFYLFKNMPISKCLFSRPLQSHAS
jgi:hypothetical protein